MTTVIEIHFKVRFVSFELTVPDLITRPDLT